MVEEPKVKPNKKKLVLRSIFMFIAMGIPMQLLVNYVPMQFPNSLVLPLVGMVGGMSANYAWEFIWAKATGRVEV